MTTFQYDPSDLKTKMTYPNGTDYQSWTYDPAKNLIARQTVNGVSQLFSYDSRNRQFAMAWSNGVDWAKLRIRRRQQNDERGKPNIDNHPWA